MESYNLGLLTKKLLESEFSLYSSKTLRDILEINNERSFYRVVNDFIKNGILTNIERNKYSLVGKNVDTFELANFLYQPSYISLESALNFWGILSQFPFEITSITSKKSFTKHIDDKVFNYSHISPKCFGMFIKKNNILIATPEKALFDQLYLASKGLKTINFDEYSLDNINKKSLLEICKQLNADTSLLKLCSQLFK